MNSDYIEVLPIDKIQPTHEELEVVNTLFKTHNNTLNVLLDEAKESLIVGFLFILFSIPQIDNLMNKYIPLTNNSNYFLILIKALFVIVIFWILKHFKLMLKKWVEACWKPAIVLFSQVNKEFTFNSGSICKMNRSDFF
jgi:hypothetical protein